MEERGKERREERREARSGKKAGERAGMRKGEEASVGKCREEGTTGEKEERRESATSTV